MQEFLGGGLQGIIFDKNDALLTKAARRERRECPD